MDRFKKGSDIFLTEHNIQECWFWDLSDWRQGSRRILFYFMAGIIHADLETFLGVVFFFAVSWVKAWNGFKRNGHDKKEGFNSCWFWLKKLNKKILKGGFTPFGFTTHFYLKKDSVLIKKAQFLPAWLFFAAARY